jgi:GntR family transcriptional regulator, rspAB operon transcriptional repressor
MDYPTLNRLDLTEQTYRILREQILKQDLQPGDKVSVDMVARGLGVSRTPVVNALKLLENDGLVEIHPRRGTFVTELTARDVSDLFEIRQMIELYAAEQLFKSDSYEEVLQQVQALLERMRNDISEGEYADYDAFISEDRDLHTTIVRAMNNRRLLEFYSDLNIHMQVTRAHYLDTIENAFEAQKDHEAMVEAIANRDINALKSALTTHLETVRTRILKLLQQRGGQL